ncbi:conserved hypothetical protein [Candidatus Magnetomoraceae bacterium gMMP-15]
MSEKKIRQEINSFLEDWKDNPKQNKKAFIVLKDHLAAKSEIKFDFKARPGVSYSLRGAHVNQKNRQLFVMMDVIDDDPADRWLSVCFYGDMITDPDEEGDLVPEGLLGEDGYCFDLDELDEDKIIYLKARLDEAYDSASKE